jgi:hypothetical protein
MSPDQGNPAPSVFWHRDLPPLDGESIGEHTIEAASVRVSGPLAHGDRMWGQCYEDLMRVAGVRVAQEIVRLDGHYAHVKRESIDSRHDDATNEGWLHGRFDYVLYRRPGGA